MSQRKSEEERIVASVLIMNAKYEQVYRAINYVKTNNKLPGNVTTDFIPAVMHYNENNYDHAAITRLMQCLK